MRCRIAPTPTLPRKREGAAWLTHPAREARRGSRAVASSCGGRAWPAVTPLDLVFMGTPEFAATILAALIDAGHRIRAVYTQPPRPAGRGHRLQPSPVQALAERHGLPVHCPASLRDPAAQAEFAAIRGRRRGRRRLRPDPADAGAGRAASRLPQCARLAAAALARRRADPARDPGRRRRDRHHDHADGRGARHRPDAAAAGDPDRAEGDRRTARRAARRARRPADRRSARRRRARHACRRARSRARARPTPRSCAARRPGSTGASPPSSWSGRCAPSIRGPAPVFEGRGERIRVLARRGRSASRAGAAPAPCSTSGCRSPAARAYSGRCWLQRAGRAPLDAPPFCAASRCRPGRYCRAPLQADDRILRHRLCRLAAPAERAVDPGGARNSGRAASAARASPCSAPGAPMPGVHALAQVAHVDLPRAAPPDEIRGAVNHHLKPHAISVLAVEPVASDFDARLSATGRRYLYRILNRRAPPALDRGRVWHVAPPLDVAAMREGAAPPDRASRFLDLPRLAVPGQIAGQDARRAGRVAGRRGNPHRRAPPARFCIIRCATWSAR